MIRRKPRRPSRRQGDHMLVHLDAPQAGDAGGKAFVGLVSGSAAPVLELDLPADLRGIARERVARRRLADMIGTDDAGAELRPLPPVERGAPWRRAILADRKALAGWRSAAGRRGGRCLALLPDYLALPTAPGIWVIDASAKAVSVRFGPDDGFSAEPGLARRMIAAALAKAKPRAVLRTGSAASDHDDLFQGTDIPLVGDPAELKKRNLPVPRAFAHGELALDLARDRGAEAARLDSALRAWRGVLLMAGLGAALYAASLWTTAREQRSLATSYRAEAVDLVRTHFVPTGPILDIRRQVAAAIAARDTGEDTGNDIGPLDRLRAALDIIVPAGAEVVAAAYQADTGWVLDLMTVDFAALEQIETDLAAAGLTVETAEARAEDAGGVAGVLRILGGVPR